MLRYKKVTVYKFCIDGDNDVGANGEHRLKLDGSRLWNGYIEFREEQCHNIYVSTCGTYEIKLAKQFEAEKRKSVCYSASVSATYKALEGTLSSNSCNYWIQPAESFIWSLKVEPAW